MEQIDIFLRDLISSCDSPAKVRKIYDKCKYSVSKIEEALAQPFDKEGVAFKTFSKHFNNPESLYYQKSVEEILKMWSDKAELGKANGRALDNFVGLILESHSTKEVLAKYKSSLNDAAFRKCNVFEKFYHDNIENKLNFLTREKILYDETTGVVGRFDALFMSGDRLLLVDWKNTENITTENGYEKLKGPLYKYDSCDLNKYTIQLYLYVYVLRKVYKLTNIKIIPLIVQIGQEDYKIYLPNIPYSDKLVEDIIEFAITEINNKTNSKE